MKKHTNYYFLSLTAILLVSGILFLATLSAPASLQIFDNTNYYLFHQLNSIAIGLILALIIFKIPLHILKKISPFLLFINLLLLIAVFLPGVGVKFGGAQRWIGIGKIIFQPAEFLKITSILYVASLISNRFSENYKKGWISFAKRGYYNFIKVFLPFLLLLGLIAVILIFQRDLSTLGIISITLLGIYFLSGTPIIHTILSLFLIVASAVFFIIREPYRIQRFLVFLRPETDPLGIGFQSRQSLISLGSGGIFGNGLGMSTQKFGFLPEAMSDSVFAILGEETGIIGTSALIIAFFLFAWIGFKIAKSATDKFSKLTAAGITTWITFQAFVNITSAIGLFPLAGIPLPFFSYGGSHIVTELIGIGILLNISKNG